MFLTRSSEIIAALSAVSEAKLLDDEKSFASYLTVREAAVLALHGDIQAYIYKGKLVDLRLNKGVTVSAAMRRLSPLQVAASNRITKRRQGNGSKKWVPHFEKSDLGSVSFHSRVVSPLSYPHRRYAVGEAQHPQAQVA